MAHTAQPKVVKLQPNTADANLTAVLLNGEHIGFVQRQYWGAGKFEYFHRNDARGWFGGHKYQRDAIASLVELATR